MSEDANIPIVGSADEPCPSCGATLAADQRYCLQCGSRRGPARVDFQRYLGGAPAPEVVHAGAPPAAPTRALTPMAIVGGIATLGVMLVLGVLIGKDNNPHTNAAPVASNPPKVIVQSGGASTGAAKKTTAATGASSKAKGKSGSGASKPAASTQATSPDALKKAGATTVGDQALKALDGSDTAANSKASAALPDTIATEGKPPKTDSKAPGAGSSATVIK